jgi:aminopeptidase N
VAGYFDDIDRYYDGAAARQERFRAFARERMRPVFARVGWEAKPGESVPTTLLRTKLIGTMADLGDQDVIAEARRRFAAQKTDPEALPVALRKTVTEVVAGNADAATWNQLHDQAKAETTPLIKDHLYTMLSVAKDDKLAQQALDLALTDEPGATNSAGMIRTVSLRHPDMAFDFAVAHREQVDKLVDNTSASRYYPSLGARSLTPGMVDKIKAYADAHIANSARRAADEVIADIQYGMMVRNERLPDVDAWLAKHTD